MGAAFPLSPVPSYYAQVTPGAPHGVFYVGGAVPSFTLSQSGATAYSVRDYWGNIITSGSVSGTTVAPAAPAGGWTAGWYRLYLTGGSTDSLFGPAYGSSCFLVLPSDSRFPAFTSAAVDSNLNDLPMKAAAGMSTSRIQIDHANAPTTGAQTLAVAQTAAATSSTYWNVASGPLYDSARPRLPWVQFPGQTVDFISLGSLAIYVKDPTIDGSTVTVTAAAGSVSGTKLTINSEVYDNLATCNAAEAALAASLLVKGFASTGNAGGNGSQPIPTHAAQTIGNAYYTGVVSVVSTLYPLGITRYEGPSNEPALNAETAHQMRIFQGAVKAGNASAKAIGPCPVSLSGIGSSFDTFLAAGGGNYCDEISFHAYNSQTNGDINLGRTQVSAFMALLAKYSLQAKPLWQTESTQVMSSVYGVYHPRRSRVPLLQTLLWEQYGVPRERNIVWYDASHGFWSFPAWTEMGDGTLNPYAGLFRTLAAETFGQTHSQVLSFGTIGDRIFLGSIYAGASTSTAVLVTTSYLPNSTVTLNVTGTAGPLTTVNGFGTTSTVTVNGGKATLSVSDIPTYVRLPAGVSVTVDHVNDWPASQIGREDLAYGYPVAASAGTVAPLVLPINGQWHTQYSANPAADGAAVGTTLPDTYTVTWPTAARLDRVLIWSGFVWQSESTLVDFDVQTSVDGTAWVTQTTVTKTTPSSFQHGADSNGTGCQQETFWDEQYIFDVKLPAPVTCKAIRLNVRATSYGGEPDAAAVTAGGQGASSRYITLQEIVPVCDNNTVPHYATLS